MSTALKPLNIVVLLHNSLLSMGIASRLKEQVDRIYVQIIDSESPDVQGVLSKQSPEIIILDSGDLECTQKISLSQLFDWVPTAKVVILDLLTQKVHVYSSQELQVSRTSELLSFFQQSYVND